MGEIADTHVEAYAAGLDPNEMDGADWAEFYADEIDQEPPTGDEIASDFRVIVVPEILRAALPDETFQDTLRRLWPGLTTIQTAAFESFLETINGFPEGDDG